METRRQHIGDFSIPLGGIQKNSFIDYPGKVSCVLFLPGCNFDCPYCHNPDLARGSVATRGAYMQEAVSEFLMKRRQFLDGVVVSGGEPTLQPNLARLCRQIQQLGFPVKLDTNGSRPEVLADLIRDQRVDYIAMDVKTHPDHYEQFVRGDGPPPDIQRSIDLIMKSGIPYEFRTTCVRPFVDRRIIEEIGRRIQGASCYVLQAFHDADVLHPEFFRGQERRIDAAELACYRDIAGAWVKRCFVR